VILTALCGHGHLDLAAYGAYLAGDLTYHELSAEELSGHVAALLPVPA
jgi:tryptophan synthase beta chain